MKWACAYSSDPSTDFIHSKSGPFPISLEQFVGAEEPSDVDSPSDWLLSDSLFWVSLSSSLDDISFEADSKRDALLIVSIICSLPDHEQEIRIIIKNYTAQYFIVLKI